MELVAKTFGSQISRLAAQRPSVNLSAKFSEKREIEAQSRTELKYEELSELLTFDANLALIDVRSPQELDTYGSIPGAVNIPLNEIKAALQLPENEFWTTFFLPKPGKGTKNLVFFARGPNASSAAVEIAHRLGYKGSRQYSGGWEDYCRRTGIPLKKNSPKVEKKQTTPFMGQLSFSTYDSHTM